MVKWNTPSNHDSYNIYAGKSYTETGNKDDNMASPVHKDSQNLRLDVLLNCSVIL